jgi:hypothetical protein
MSGPLDVSAAVERIEALSAELAERSGGRTRLLPVTKALPVVAVEAVRRAGDISWHLIGRLQRNKVRRLAGIVALWQTVDRIELLDEIARREPSASVLVQVDAVMLSGRGGCSPGEVEGLVAHGLDLGLDVRGLMTVGAPDDAGATQRGFTTVAGMAERMGLPELSMGMTDDLEIAIDCGSTLVRVGRALFGERPST